MSGVLRPVGPEPVRVYWLRRVIVIAAAVLSLVLVIAIVVNLNSPASASGPEPVPPTTAPATTPTPSTPSTASTSPSAAPASSPTPTGSAAASTTPSSAPKPKASTPSTAKARAKASARTTAKPSPAEIAACDPAQLRPTLTGKQAVKVKSKTNLDLSLINGGPQACRLTLNSGNFAVTIYSGRDRIWSTRDCTDLVKPVSVKIASEDAYEWRLVWDGRRSKKSCKTRPEIPKAGTYVATAQFKGTDPVRFRMFLKN